MADGEVRDDAPTVVLAAIGGAKKVVAEAKRAMKAGDYRWSSDLLNQLVFADPGNKAARAMLADSYEQQGYQAESAIWRNQFSSVCHAGINVIVPGAPSCSSAPPR